MLECSFVPSIILRASQQTQLLRKGTLKLNERVNIKHRYQMVKCFLNTVPQRALCVTQDPKVT